MRILRKYVPNATTLRDISPEVLAAHARELPEVVRRLTEEYRAHRDVIEDFRHPAYARYEGVDPETGKPISHYLTW